MSQLTDILFLDIETVTQSPSLKECSVAMQDLWKHKHDILYRDKDVPYNESYRDRGAIYAEFGKIVCISMGVYDFDNKDFRIKSIQSEDENELLKEFSEVLRKLPSTQQFCGHNIREFDVPYICRRLLVNGLKIPDIINYQDKKPWEINLLDTLQMWKFGDYKNYTSLHTLTTIMGIESPKTDMDGSMVGKVYWEEKDLNKIKTYCEQDVVALIQLYLRLSQTPLDKIEFVYV